MTDILFIEIDEENSLTLQTEGESDLIVEESATEILAIVVEGEQGIPGPQGEIGPEGPAAYDDLADFTLIFENGLI